MKWKQLSAKKEQVIIKRIEVDGVTLNATGTLYDLLNELEDCDGYFTCLTIDEDTGKKLETLGIASRNIRGSYSPNNNKKLKELKDIVCKVVYGGD